ncbi:MAG: hypothetical protein AAFR96_09315 [Planctomycetota bacterium]
MTTFSTARPRADLDVLSESFSFKDQQFVADHLFPAYETDERSAEFDKLIIGTNEELVAAADQRRAAGSAFRESNHETRSDQYATREYGEQHAVDLRQGARNSRMIRKKEETGSRMIYRRVLRGREQEVIDATVSNTTDFTAAKKNALTVSQTFAADSDILGEIERAKDQFQENCGLLPNVITIPREQRRVISANTTFGNQYGDDRTRPGNLTAEMIAEIIDIPGVYFPFVSYNGKPQGQAALMRNLWPANKIFMAYVDPAASIEEVQLGRTIFNIDGESCGSGRFGSFMSDNRHSMVIWYGQDRKTKLLNENCGLVLTTTAA